MTKVLLLKTYKARKPGVILDIPQAEAHSLESLGIGEILKEEQPAPKKAGKGSDAE
ncbi:hypothetical protein HFO77_23440 [Rhizobium leguminosarum]|uniref:hypothetical protein n=1 Tax=Rhizobium leguminosarum TaxID=384 RepID=UPI001C953C0F|nr:hypothetical protein [Rhizobium leguminosarum]MBY5917350.1 hypothetical protein [Rhizobium leguminosarum]